MEPVGVAVGIVGLAGLFSNAVDCFEYVQLGRQFGSDFQTCALTLDIARLRLSRWGQSMGLSPNVDDTQSLRQVVAIEDLPKAEMILGHILELFADAEGISTKFKMRASTEESTLAVYDRQTELEPVRATLHQKLCELSIKRQNQTQLRQKVKWAQYEEKHFRRLIEDVVGLINNLVELFPAAQTSQQELCELEVQELGTNEGLPILKDIAAGQDEYLEAAVSKALQDSVGVDACMLFPFDS